MFHQATKAEVDPRWKSSVAAKTSKASPPPHAVSAQPPPAQWSLPSQAQLRWLVAVRLRAWEWDSWRFGLSSLTLKRRAGLGISSGDGGWGSKQLATRNLVFMKIRMFARPHASHEIIFQYMFQYISIYVTHTGTRYQWEQQLRELPGVKYGFR